MQDVSGRRGMNLSGVYYEVWNEPDGEGFGHFSIGSGKDYFTLYQKTVGAALQAQNVNTFKIGGPALADLRRCTNGLLFICQEYWLDKFLSLTAETNTRLDFISWHQYSLKISDYNENVNFLLKAYSRHPSLAPVEKIITEWGSVPERNPIHGGVFDAAHLVAAARTFIGYVDMATKFEIRDGPGDSGSGWGIIGYDGKVKPTYTALAFLNQIRSDRILLSGEGTYVTGIASRDSSGVTVIMTNYDPKWGNIETVPLTIKNLVPGRYRLRKSALNAPSCSEATVTITSGVFHNADYPGCNNPNQLLMPANSVVVYDLQLVGLVQSQ